MREEGAEGEEGGFKSVRDTVYESYVRALEEGKRGKDRSGNPLLVTLRFLKQSKHRLHKQICLPARTISMHHCCW